MYLVLFCYQHFHNIHAKSKLIPQYHSLECAAKRSQILGFQNVGMPEWVLDKYLQEWVQGKLIYNRMIFSLYHIKYLEFPLMPITLNFTRKTTLFLLQIKVKQMARNLHTWQRFIFILTLRRMEYKTHSFPIPLTKIRMLYHQLKNIFVLPLL